MKENKDLFALSINDLGECVVREHNIYLIDDKLILLHPYRKSASERQELQREINKMINLEE